MRPNTKNPNLGTENLKKATKLKVKKTKKSFKRNALLFANICLLLVVGSLVWLGQRSPATTTTNLSQIGTSVAAAPLDTLSSADIAVNIAQMVNMPEVVPITNQADSVTAQVVSQAAVEEASVAKPQLVDGGAKSRQDIQKYSAQPSETIASIAEKFGVSADSIKWSNDLNSDTVPSARELIIPPRNGIVYQVKEGDTVDSLAAKYSASKEQIIAFNDAELSGSLPVGENILIPDGKKPVTPTFTARTTTSNTTPTASSAAIYGFTARYGGNGYVPGYCTWYAANRVSVPNNWGNANTWDNRARSTAGWTVSSVPVAGAIFQTDLGWAGHVGIVEEIYADGTMLVSDMNGFSGFGRVGTARVPLNEYPNYIYR